jgi:hypothetical protein
MGNIDALATQSAQSRCAVMSAAITAIGSVICGGPPAACDRAPRRPRRDVNVDPELSDAGLVYGAVGLERAFARRLSSSIGLAPGHIRERMRRHRETRAKPYAGGSGARERVSATQGEAQTVYAVTGIRIRLIALGLRNAAMKRS